MEASIMTALISAAAAVIGALSGYAASKRKSDVEEESIENQNKLLIYKVDVLIRDVKELSQKLDDYSFRLATLEANVKAIEKRVDDIEHSAS